MASQAELGWVNRIQGELKEESARFDTIVQSVESENQSLHEAYQSIVSSESSTDELARRLTGPDLKETVAGQTLQLEALAEDSIMKDRYVEGKKALRKEVERRLATEQEALDLKALLASAKKEKPPTKSKSPNESFLIALWQVYEANSH